MIAPILAHFCAIGTKCKFTAKIAVTKRKIHLFFTENKKRVISTNFREKSATPARGQVPGIRHWRSVVSARYLSPGRGKEKSFTW